MVKGGAAGRKLEDFARGPWSEDSETWQLFDDRLLKRWIGERTFAWLACYRRLSRDYKRCTESSETMIYLSIIALMSRRLAFVN